MKKLVLTLPKAEVEAFVAKVNNSHTAMLYGFQIKTEDSNNEGEVCLYSTGDTVEAMSIGMGFMLGLYFGVK